MPRQRNRFARRASTGSSGRRAACRSGAAPALRHRRESARRLPHGRHGRASAGRRPPSCPSSARARCTARRCGAAAVSGITRRTRARRIGQDRVFTVPRYVRRRRVVGEIRAHEPTRAGFPTKPDPSRRRGAASTAAACCQHRPSPFAHGFQHHAADLLHACRERLHAGRMQEVRQVRPSAARGAKPCAARSNMACGSTHPARSASLVRLSAPAPVGAGAARKVGVS